MQASTPPAESMGSRPQPPPAASGAVAAHSELLSALLAAIEDSLCTSMFASAIFYAERLFECQPTYRHLHILASCHARGGGAATACRLLQNYYPFFEVHVTRPGSAGNHRIFSPAAPGANPAHTPASLMASSPPRSSGSPHLGRPRHRFSQPRATAVGSVGVDGGQRFSSAAGASARGESPLGIGVRSALRRGDNGEAIPSHAPVDLAARWDCQYLFGVSCAQTGRYTEGTKVLEELLRVCARLEAAESHNDVGLWQDEEGEEGEEAEEEGGVGDSAGEDSAAAEVLAQRRRLRRQQRLRSLGSCTAGCRRFYVQRVGEVQHWLGVCAQRQHMDAGPELHRSAFLANPLLFEAFESYVRGAWRPGRDACLRPYASAEPYSFPTATHLSPAAAAATPPTRGEAERRPRAGPPPSQAEVLREAQELQEKNALRRFLLPYATATFLVHTFRCQEAQKALQPEAFLLAFAANPTSTLPSQQQQRPQEEERERVDGAGETAELARRMATSPWRLSLSALSRFHFGDMQGSATLFHRLLAVAPWRLHDPALMYFSTALWQLRAEGDLGALAQRLTEEMPMSPITLVVVANTYSLAKEPKDAIAMLDRAIQMDSSAAYAHALRGYELLSMGMSKEARDAFNKAVNTDHNMYTAYAGLGELSVREERVDSARQYFKQAIALNPLPAIMNRYAATHHRRGASREDLLAAYTIYTEAIRHNTTNVSARHQRADVLLALGKPKEALREIEEMVQRYPDEAMLHVTLARCQESLGLTRQAVMSYHRAMTLDPRREGFVRGCIEKLSAAASGEGDSSGAE